MRRADARRAAPPAGAGSGGAVHFGARRGEGIDELVETIASRLALDVRRVTLTFDPDDAARSRADRARLSPRPRRRRTKRATAGVDRRRRAAPASADRSTSARSAAATVNIDSRRAVNCLMRALLLAALVLASACAPKTMSAAGRAAPKFPGFRRADRPAGVGTAARGCREPEPRLGVPAGRRPQERRARVFGRAAKRCRRFFPPRRRSATSSSRARTPKRRCRTSTSALERNRPLRCRRSSARGEALLALGREADALAAFEAALAVDPSLDRRRAAASRC